MDFTAPFIVDEEKFSENKEPCGKTNLNLTFEDHCDKEASCSCVECQESFCSDCIENHLSSKKYKSHTKTVLSTKFPKCLNHPNKPSEIFCFDDNSCLCSSCAILDHKDHDISEIKEANQRIQLSTEEKIKNTQESIKKINVDISEINEKYEQDSKKLKENYMRDLDTLKETKLKLNENLNTLEELKLNLKTSKDLSILKMKDEYDITRSEDYKEIYACGCNAYGQLGLGNTTKQSTPQLISPLKYERIKNVVCGFQYTMVTTGKFLFHEINRIWSLFLWL
jgi:hypothetical protein